MIDIKLQNIERSLQTHKTILDLYLRINGSLDEFPISAQITQADTHFRYQDKTLKNIKDSLTTTEERLAAIYDSIDIPSISPSISRLKEFSYPIPENIVLRWSDTYRAFEYVSHYDLALSIGTSIYDLDNYPAFEADSIVTSDSTSLYYTTIDSVFYQREIYQTNGTISISTVPSHTHIFIEGSEVVFDLGSDWVAANYYVINTSGTSELVFEGADLPRSSAQVYYELAYTTNRYFNEEQSLIDGWFLV